MFNIYRNEYENPIDVIGAVIKASADPVKLGELLDIKVREKEQREREVSEEVNATVNKVENEIEGIKKKVPTEEGIQGKGGSLRSKYNALEKSVIKEHDKARETLNKTAEKLVKTVLEQDEKGQAIYENSGLGGKIESIEPKYKAYRSFREYNKKLKEISPLSSRSSPISAITNRPLDKTPFIPWANVGLPSAPKGLNK